MSAIEADIPVAPAPWRLKGKSWLLFLSGVPKLSSFPTGFASPHEAETLATGGEYIGGPGVVQLVSYTESPVGPYDELIYIPGRWQYADGSRGFRITRIFVSTKASTENGRRNWNIPKHVADFDYKQAADGKMHFSVSLPGASSPFFKATLQSLPIITRIPVPGKTTLFGLGQYLKLIQPPLPAGDNPEEVGTSQWVELAPVMKGTAHATWVTPEMDGKLGDGVSFPAVTPWSLAVFLDYADFDFVVGTFQDSR